MTPETEHVHSRSASDFHCIGGECEDTCCQGMWVVIDKTTYDKYQKFPPGELRSLVEQYVTVRTADQTDALYAQIGQTPSHDCPFFGADHLCKVQKEYGAEALSPTCAIYPRALNNVQGRLKFSLYLSCPEAARVVLLNAKPAEAPDCVSPTDFPSGQFLHLAANGESPIYKPFSHFQEVRSVIVDLLRDRRRPLWQRLFLLGTLCRELDGISTPEQETMVPKILASLQANTSALCGEIERIEARSVVRFDFVVRMANLRIQQGSASERFVQCFKAFLECIGYASATMESGLRRYVEAEEKFCRPFLERYPFIMENYLLHYVFRTLFPFGRKPSPHYTQQRIFDEYLLLIAQFALLRGMLIGMAGKYQEEFGTDHVVTLVQSVSKAVEHYPLYMQELTKFIRNQHLDSPEGIASLLR